MNFKAVRPQRASDQVFEQLRGMIVRGELRPGEKIPSERELASLTGVSRPTVRAALHKLVAQGLIENRQGHGTFVRFPTPGDTDNPLRGLVGDHQPSLIELLEVRLGLECNAARFAAQRATADDIGFLERTCASMRQQHERGSLDFDSDTSFHMGVATASHNPMQLSIMKSLHDLLRYGISENLRRLYLSPGNLERVLDHHERILEAIKRRSADEAYRAMEQHISFVIEYFSEN